MATKLYVGGLPYSTQEDALKELFAQAGTVVSAVIIMDKMSGRSKGFGFVEMDSNDAAQKAISMFNDQEFEYCIERYKNCLILLPGWFLNHLTHNILFPS